MRRIMSTYWGQFSMKLIFTAVAFQLATMLFIILWLSTLSQQNKSRLSKSADLDDRSQQKTMDALNLKPTEIIRWEALAELDGAKYYGPGTFNVKNCSNEAFVTLETPVSTFRKYTFFGTELFNYMQNKDVVEKICQFKQRRSILNDAPEWQDYKLLINQPKVCSNRETDQVELLMLIKSAHNHEVERNTIRGLWADSSCWAGRTVRHVFLLGSTDNATWTRRVAREAGRFADVIQQDFHDDYYNNTLKVLFGLQWALSFCPEAQWILFVDDDMFVNPRNVLALLKSLDLRFYTGLLFGNQRTFPPVTRENSKWAIDEDVYPHDYYPSYVSGATILVGSKLALDLYIGSRFTRMIPFDDAFFGLVLNALLLIPVHLRGVYVDDYSELSKLSRSRQFTLHGVSSPFRQRKFWIQMKTSEMCDPQKKQVQ
ncbi:Beta-1,3-galactosyltransferase 5 [Clonorchis sinensis]|uniref:Beta-1,3-galactosyltransferase 5 n=2 Tax=Clonorchis sinensis TaxID=79923 RepID=A0A8T1M1G9_CLOSI|nr:Beta-1,3-galactosyltransferase 5 [Clonorchis sinensis]GAA54806.1 beta-1 3-galactosyltransferase 5 [Clonorchis sinensis]